MKKPMKALLLTAALLSLPSIAHAAPVRGHDGVTVNVPNPRRVVALNATTLELIARLGRLNTVVGRDVTGTFPANDIASVGHWAQLPAEGIISLRPDLVIGTADNFSTPTNATTLQQLRAAGVPVLVLPPSDSGGMGGLLTRVDMLSAVYDLPRVSQSLRSTLQAQLAVLQNMRLNRKPRVVFLYAHSASDASIYGRGSAASLLIEMAGGENVAPFEGTRALTAEALIGLAPDVIIMLQRGLDAVGGKEGALRMPGVAQTPAGRAGRIYTTDNSIRWIGPRFPAFALALRQAWQKELR